MINNDESRRAIAKGFRKLFTDQLARVVAVYLTLAMVVKSSGASEKYVWTEDLGGMEPWVGDRTRQNLKDHSFEIVNRM
ncbi:MAG: Mu-like prophage major head subunit gpT family protein, partial [Deltaproteobacteria bacterium]|nr:Mu-like prophage major head subunit gpT family protein [Deltaproteobacteria bacterium]